MDPQQLYRGLPRGSTSDVVGGPADIAEQLAKPAKKYPEFAQQWPELFPPE